MTAVSAIRAAQSTEAEAVWAEARGLRVLAFCDYFHPGAGGGAERVAFEVYGRLASWGAHVTVLTTGRPNDGWRWETDGLRVVEVPSLDLTRRLGVQSSVTRGAARLAARVAAGVGPHVLHANSLQFQTSLAAARLQRRSGLPMVVTAHLAGFEALPRLLQTLAAVHERTLGRYVLSRGTRVIAVSRPVADHLSRYPGLRSRIRIIPNGVDHERFRPAAQVALRSSDVRVAFVGRLVPNKGPHLLIEAFGSLRREGLAVGLLVVGDGPMRGKLERRVQELGMADAVRFAGFSDKVEELLREAEVLVRPTLTEGMPLAVLEAMASGVCVVASDIPGNASLIKHGKTGLLFPAGHVGGLTTALLRAIHDRGERERLARAALIESRQYSWDRCARETLSVLREVVPLRAGRSAV